MSNDFITGMIFRTENQIVELLHSTIGEYETLMKLSEDYKIQEWMDALRQHAQADTGWISEVYSTTLQYDMYTSGVTSFLSMIESKQIDLEKYRYLGFQKQQLLQMFEVLQNLSNVDVVDESSIYMLANQADKLLEKNTAEYKVIRMLCISKIIGLINVTNVISKLIMSQDAIKKKEKIRITPDIDS